MIKLTWPAVLTDPAFEYDTADKNHVALALAEGLMAWGHCSLGIELCGKLPAEFGRGMAKIAKVTACTGDAKALAARARELGLVAD